MTDVPINEIWAGLVGGGVAIFAIGYGFNSIIAKLRNGNGNKKPTFQTEKMCNDRHERLTQDIASLKANADQIPVIATRLSAVELQVAHIPKLFTKLEVIESVVVRNERPGPKIG